MMNAATILISGAFFLFFLCSVLIWMRWKGACDEARTGAWATGLIGSAFVFASAMTFIGPPKFSFDNDEYRIIMKCFENSRCDPNELIQSLKNRKINDERDIR